MSSVLEADEARVGSRVGGRVLRVYVVEGQRVDAGALLVEIEPFDLIERQTEARAERAANKAAYDLLLAGFRTEDIAMAQAKRDEAKAVLDKLLTGPRRQELSAAEARLTSAQAEKQLAEQDHERTKVLFDKHAIARQDLDKAASRLEVTTAKVNELKEEVAQLEEGTREEEISEARSRYEAAQQEFLRLTRGYRTEELQQAEARVQAAEARLAQVNKQVEELRITAPISGIVNAIELVPGDLITANAPALTIVDTKHLWLRAYVPENRMNISLNEPVQISFDSIPDQKIRGHVAYVSSIAEFVPSNVQTAEERSEQVFRIKVLIDEPAKNLRPGMAADIGFQD